MTYSCKIFVYVLSFVSFFLSEPWFHVLYTVGGAWAANKWVKLEAGLLADVNEIRAYKGLPPMVGTTYYFPLVPPKFEEGKQS